MSKPKLSLGPVLPTNWSKEFRRGAAGLLTGVMALAVIFIPSTRASGVTSIYNNIPSPQPGNLPSQAFEATTASEFGGQVQFAGTVRTDPTVTVLMSSWGCTSGHWYSGDCVTTPGATFSEPITLNIYAVNGDNSPGAVVATQTQTFNIPYRPSADNTNCTGDNAGKWFSTSDSTCYNGYATPISFSLTGVTLPDKVITSVAYNTTHYGYNPIGEGAACYSSAGGCGYDSLNVALAYPPSVGSDPLPNDAYQDTISGSCTDGSIHPFGLDQGCWTGFQPAIRFDVAEAQVLGFATGGLTLTSPRQQISFNAFDYGVASPSDRGTVEYQNFEYPGGLHYTANVMCTTVTGNDARFMFQIPPGFPGLSGLYVVASVHDGGSPGAKFDTYGHTATSDLATAQSWCENGASVTNYKITGGNSVVH